MHENEVVLLGAGGHAKVIIDILLKCNKYKIAGILGKDSSHSDKSLLDIPVLGSDILLEELYQKGIRNVIVAVGSVKGSKLRQELFKKARDSGMSLINAIHPTAVIGWGVEIGEGTAIMASVVINPCALIGNNCILNTACILEHDVIIGNHVHIAPGARVAGGVKIGDGSHIGIGAIILQNIKIGSNAIIGAGAVVINDVAENTTVVGIPAKIIRTLEG